MSKITYSFPPEMPPAPDITFTWCEVPRYKLDWDKILAPGGTGNPIDVKAEVTVLQPPRPALPAPQ